MKKINIACVIDDDPTYTFIVKRLIDIAEIADSTIFFHDGKAALDFFVEYMWQLEKLPELILLDINMPVLDGWQFMEEFVKLTPSIGKKITVYIVSSSVDQADHNKAREIEAISDFLIKPITVQMLKKLVEELA